MTTPLYLVKIKISEGPLKDSILLIQTFDKNIVLSVNNSSLIKVVESPILKTNLVIPYIIIGMMIYGYPYELLGYSSESIS